MVLEPTVRAQVCSLLLVLSPLVTSTTDYHLRRAIRPFTAQGHTHAQSQTTKDNIELTISELVSVVQGFILNSIALPLD